MLTRLPRASFAFAIVLAAAGPTWAQEPAQPPVPVPSVPTQPPGAATAASSTAPSAHDIPTLDTTVPDAPAFTILGITPTQITRPTTPTEVATAIATAIGTDGMLHSGAAIELAPGQLIHPVDLWEYQNHLYYQYLHNFQVSLGTSSTLAPLTAGGIPTSATDLAVGFRLTLYDEQDPLLNKNLMNAYKAIFDKRLPPPFPTSGGVPTDLPPDLQAQLADAMSKAKATGWNTSAVQLAGAYAWTSLDSSLKNLVHKGWGAWLTGSYGFGSWGQAIGVIRGLNGSANATDPGTTLVLGARLVVGGPKWGLSAEGAYNHLWADSPAVSDGWGQATAAFEVNLASGAWLELSFGDTFDRLGQNDRFFSLANFKWAVASQRVILSGTGH